MINTDCVLVRWPPLALAHVIKNHVNNQVYLQIRYQVSYQEGIEVWEKIFR